jgi:hypothetical protein
MNSRIPRLFSVFIVCGCVLFSQWAYAQDPPIEQTAPPAAQTAPAPEQKATLSGPADKDLSFLLGKWETKAKIFPNALLGNTEEVKGAGTAEYRAFGVVVEGSRLSETSLGRFEDKEFIWYDQSTKAYNIISISPEGYAINKKMTMAGEKYVIEYSGRDKAGTPKEKDFTVRAKYKIVSDTEVKYSSEVKIGKADFVPFLQLKMQRVSK